MTATCWASFWPKNATSGWAMLSSFATTVATPAKCAAPRCAPSVELGHRDAADGGEDRCVALPGGVAGADRLEAAVQRERTAALFAAQAHVAARQRQPVGLADGGADLDPHRDVEVAHDAADDRDLLRVLLAEEGDVGLGDVQQLRDDGGDAGEVRGAALGALERGADLVDRDRRGEASRVDLAAPRREQKVGAQAERVDLAGRRREEDVGAGLGGQRRVAGLVARVGGEVGGLVELRWVDEQRHDDLVAGRMGAADEREMALVQGAHRRDEADAAPGAARPVERGAELGDRAQGLHRVTATGVVALRAARRRVASASASNSASSSGSRSATAARWRATVASSPRAIGPVRARSAPSAAQLATLAWTSATSGSRSTPAVAARRSARPSSVTRKFEAIEAAAW